MKTADKYYYVLLTNAVRKITLAKIGGNLKGKRNLLERRNDKYG